VNPLEEELRASLAIARSEIFIRDAGHLYCIGRQGRDGTNRLAPLLVRLRGGTVREIKVEHRRRRCGKPKYQSARRLLEGLRNLLRLRFGLS
jgi:hypothetical protein